MVKEKTEKPAPSRCRQEKTKKEQLWRELVEKRKKVYRLSCLYTFVKVQRLRGSRKITLIGRGGDSNLGHIPNWTNLPRYRGYFSGDPVFNGVGVGSH